MNFKFDLVCMVADTNMRLSLAQLFQRHRAMKVRPFSLYKGTPLTHPQHDAGCLRSSGDILRHISRQAHHALVVFDHEGCGREAESRSALERDVEEQLHRSGWQDRAAAVVIEPELESWVFSPSPNVAEALGWRGRNEDLRRWWEDQGFLAPGERKACDPKKAVERAMRHANKVRSSSIYEQLARSVSFKRCEDPAFKKLCDTLQSWFPAKVKG